MPKATLDERGSLLSRPVEWASECTDGCTYSVIQKRVIKEEVNHEGLPDNVTVKRQLMPSI